MHIWKFRQFVTCTVLACHNKCQLTSVSVLDRINKGRLNGHMATMSGTAAYLVMSHCWMLLSFVVRAYSLLCWFFVPWELYDTETYNETQPLYQQQEASAVFDRLTGFSLCLCTILTKLLTSAGQWFQLNSLVEHPTDPWTKHIKYICSMDMKVATVAFMFQQSRCILKLKHTRVCTGFWVNLVLISSGLWIHMRGTLQCKTVMNGLIVAFIYFLLKCVPFQLCFGFLLTVTVECLSPVVSYAALAWHIVNMCQRDQTLTFFIYINGHVYGFRGHRWEYACCFLCVCLIWTPTPLMGYVRAGQLESVLLKYSVDCAAHRAYVRHQGISYLLW